MILASDQNVQSSSARFHEKNEIICLFYFKIK